MSVGIAGIDAINLLERRSVLGQLLGKAEPEQAFRTECPCGGRRQLGAACGTITGISSFYHGCSVRASIDFKTGLSTQYATYSRHKVTNEAFISISLNG